MGRDPMSVVNGELKVYGIENLRIADGSIMPRVKPSIRHSLGGCLSKWASPRLCAQANGPQTNQGLGQHGEFNGDYQDTGAAATDATEAPETTETREAKEAAEVTAAARTGESVSVTEPVSSLPDTDRIQDLHSDTSPTEP
jgi:hypothetical protein